jgi:dTDP-4-dehydrorhamnose reductase
MADSRKILVTGSNGLLGQAMVRMFKEDYFVMGCDLTGESFNKNFPEHEFFQLDLTQRDKVRKFFSNTKPDVIINTAAFTDVDQSEEKRDLCWTTNVRSVEILVEIVLEYAPVFVQISTDYVFDGKSGSYRETDATNPVSYYGHTKLAAEKILRSSGLEYIIARSMVLYGHGQKVRNNFVTWVIQQLKNGSKIKVVNDQWGNPTLVDDLSEAIKRLLEKEEYGIFHVAGNEVCSRYEFAQKIIDVFGLDSSLMEEVNSSQFKQPAPRPVNSSFNLDKLSNTLDWLPGKLEESLLKLKIQLDKA